MKQHELWCWHIAVFEAVLLMKIDLRRALDVGAREHEHIFRDLLMTIDWGVFALLRRKYGLEQVLEPICLEKYDDKLARNTEEFLKWYDSIFDLYVDVECETEVEYMVRDLARSMKCAIEIAERKLKEGVEALDHKRR